jgi:hypothetical protein
MIEGQIDHSPLMLVYYFYHTHSLSKATDLLSHCVLVSFFFHFNFIIIASLLFWLNLYALSLIGCLCCHSLFFVLLCRYVIYATMDEWMDRWIDVRTYVIPHTLFTCPSIALHLASPLHIYLPILPCLHTYAG